MKKVLIVAVHPDDETLGCGGTILKHADKGDDIYWLIITAPTIDHPGKYPLELIEKEERQNRAVAEKFGFKKVFNLNLPTQLLGELSFMELVGTIDKVIKEIEPEIIYLNNRSDLHSDHRIAFDAVYSCTKNFRKPYIERILMFETLSETEFSPALTENAFVPNVFVDISAFMDKKLEIMSVYASEVMPDNLPRSYRAMKGLASYRGSRIGVDSAEAFMLIYERI